ncbi:fatty acid desaturase [Qipengyuania sp. JC766]|uniref:fatty acid desaturase n=1 Tax=Qipengyuania sp. JC766 TaxID=3232139 RepID=UPI00345A1AA9
MVREPRRISRNRQQALIGLSLASAIFAAWLGVLGYALFAFDFSWGNAPFAIGIAALLCWLFVGLFIVSHDAMHGSLAPGMPRVNAAVGATLLFLYAGFDWDKLKTAHFAHHKAPGTASDPDFAADHPEAFWPWYGVFLRRYFGWTSIVFVVAVFWICHLAFDVSVGKMLFFYALPSIASSIQLFYFGTYRPHRQGGEPFADRHRARSDGFGSLASLASCYHFGYHHEHHCHPHTPWWALPAKRRAVAAERSLALDGARP